MLASVMYIPLSKIRKTVGENSFRINHRLKGRQYPYVYSPKSLHVFVCLKIAVLGVESTKNHASTRHITLFVRMDFSCV